ncbi:hypothetical protein AVEN_35935-1 [Araneus ventricosus]|uniref:Uncharacterized protein n=1 Tax=Araneus ventricosus TaxID=182803 RepID=A0A4Y2QA43_ARAVE|nr:hypothetical protein AVEN_35935-1 [Araneus ventricosus]
MHSGNQNEGRHGSKRGTESGVLMTTTAMSQPLPQEEFPVIGLEVTQLYTSIVPTREVRTRRFIQQLLIPIPKVFLGGIIMICRWRQYKFSFHFQKSLCLSECMSS